MPLEPIPLEVIDPLGSLTAQQRAFRRWYLRNIEYKRFQSRKNWARDRQRQNALRVERYYIHLYIGAQTVAPLLNHPTTVLQSLVRSFQRRALLESTLE